jgi:hypothetical protein
MLLHSMAPLHTAAATVQHAAVGAAPNAAPKKSSNTARCDTRRFSQFSASIFFF